MKARQYCWMIIATASCTACIPHRADYLHIELSGTDLAITETGKPTDVTFYTGDPIPLRYEGLLDETSIVIRDHSETKFVPAIEISITPPEAAVVRIRNQRPNCERTHERPNGNIIAFWHCTNEGGAVSLQIQAKDSNAILELHGTVKKAGRFTAYHAPL